MQISWQPADAELSEVVIDFVEAHSGVDNPLPSKDSLTVRKAYLRFYRRLAFVELTDKAQTPPRQLYALLDPDIDGVTIIDMTNAPIYELNRDGYLRLRNTEDAIAYLAFFFSCVAGPYGLMPMIESLAAPESEDQNPEAAEALASLDDVVPPQATLESDESWRVRCALLFQGAVFRCEVLISSEGTVKVDKHELALASVQPDADGDGESSEATQ